MFYFCLVKVAVCEPSRFEVGWPPTFGLLKLEGCTPKLVFSKLLKWGEGGSNLPRQKGSGGGGGWNGSKLDGPRPGEGSGGGLGSIYGGETGLTGQGKFPVVIVVVFWKCGFSLQHI